MSLSQYQALTGRKPVGTDYTTQMQSQLGDPLRQKYLQKQENERFKEQQALDEKRMDLLKQQVESEKIEASERLGFEKEKSLQERELANYQLEAAKKQGDMATKLGIASLGVQALPILGSTAAKVGSGLFSAGQAATGSGLQGSGSLAGLQSTGYSPATGSLASGMASYVAPATAAVMAAKHYISRYEGLDNDKIKEKLAEDIGWHSLMGPTAFIKDVAAGADEIITGGKISKEVEKGWDKIVKDPIKSLGKKLGIG